MDAINYNDLARLGRKIALETLKRRQRSLYDFVGMEASSDRDQLHGAFRSQRSPSAPANLIRLVTAA